MFPFLHIRASGETVIVLVSCISESQTREGIAAQRRPDAEIQRVPVQQVSEGTASHETVFTLVSDLKCCTRGTWKLRTSAYEACRTELPLVTVVVEKAKACKRAALPGPTGRAWTQSWDATS